MRLTPRHKKLLLEVHIPYRMTAVERMCWVCENVAFIHNASNVTVRADGVQIIASPNLRFLTNPLLDSGAIYGRLFLEFMGFRWSEKTRQLVRVGSRRPGDIRIEDFGVPELQLSDLFQAPHASRRAMASGCQAVIQTAHRAVAHLSARGPKIRLPERLPLGGRVILWGVGEYLYRRLDQPIPNYPRWLPPGAEALPRG